MRKVYLALLVGVAFVGSGSLYVEGLPNASAEEVCVGEAAWLTDTGPLDGAEPNPPEECGFYRRSWQAFLHITREENGKPAFLGYETYLSVFGGAPVPSALNKFSQILAVRTPEPSGPVFDGGVNQAFSSAVIDKNGNPLYYSVEIDPLFTKFIRDNKLNDLAVLRDPAIQIADIPDGAVEIKASWQIVDDAAKFQDYLVTQAQVFPLKQDGDHINVDTAATPRDVSVALLGIHVVFKLANHPELIWATFEHIDANGDFDLVPRSEFLPDEVPDKNVPVSPKDFTLYKAGTSYDQGNLEQLPMTLQPDGTIDKRSSIYRAYPWSQKRIAGDTEANPLLEDEDVRTLNQSLADHFKAIAPNDIRSNYKLVGTVWLEKGSQDFEVGKPIKEENLAGERGLSNAAIESMTQGEGFPHCFSCHNPTKGSGLPSRAINISHLFKKFSADN